MALFWLRTSYHAQRYMFQRYMLRSLLTQSFNTVNTPIILLFSKKWVPGFAAEDNTTFNNSFARKKTCFIRNQEAVNFILPYCVSVVYKSHAERHPKYLSGKWTLDEVMQNFLDTFDSAEGEDKDGVVTQEEFLNYYAAISCTIEDDAYFDLMMRNAWGLPSKKTVSRGQSSASLSGGK